MNVALWHYTNENDKSTYMPLGIRYLKSYAEQYCEQHHNVTIIERLHELTDDVDVVAISCMSQDFELLKEQLQEIRKRVRDIVLGGYHISLMPETLPEEVAVGVRFEGEETFREILDIRARNGSLLPEYLSDVKGIVYRNKGNVQINPLREPIKKMETIPFPDRTSLMKPWWQKKQNLFSSRGCPFKCVFCSSTNFWSRFRRFGAEYVVDEICAILRDFPDTQEITFVDDLFTADRKRLRNIISLMEERNILGKLLINISIRADQVDDEMCQLLKALNANFIYFGMESASPRILNYLKKGTLTVPQIQHALDLLYRNDIPISASIIVGSPGETEEDLRMTYDFVVRNMREGKLNEVAANILSPMPGTELWEEGKTRGIIQEPVEWSRMLYYGYTHTEKFYNRPFQEWVKLRSQNDSFYLNDEMSQHRLYEIMLEYDVQIKKIFVGRIYRKYRDLIENIFAQLQPDRKLIVYYVNEISYTLVHLLREQNFEVSYVITDDDEMNYTYLSDVPVLQSGQWSRIEDGHIVISCSEKDSVEVQRLTEKKRLDLINLTAETLRAGGGRVVEAERK